MTDEMAPRGDGWLWCTRLAGTEERSAPAAPLAPPRLLLLPVSSLSRADCSEGDPAPAPAVRGRALPGAEGDRAPEADCGRERLP